MSTGSEVIVHEDSGTLAGDVASRLLEVLELVQGDGRAPQIALTGGTIADAVHREVARRAPDSSVDWSRVVVWWGDERFVPAGAPDRNATQAREAFLDEVGVDPANVHEMPAADGGLDLDAAATAYGEEIRSHGSGAFDVVMLGVGPDGHVASLFPGHPALDIDDQVAVAVRDVAEAAARAHLAHVRRTQPRGRRVVHGQRLREGRRRRVGPGERGCPRDTRSRRPRSVRDAVAAGRGRRVAALTRAGPGMRFVRESWGSCPVRWARTPGVTGYPVTPGARLRR